VTDGGAGRPPSKQSRGALFWVVVIGGPLVLCCGGGVAWLISQAGPVLGIRPPFTAERAQALSDALTKDAVAETAAVDTFIAHVDAGRDAEAWAMTSAGWRSVTSQPQSDEFFRAVRGVLGRCSSKRLKTLNEQSFVAGPGTVDLAYDAVFEKGPGVIRVTTAVGAAGREIHAFRVESPLFTDGAQRAAGMPDSPVPGAGADDPETPK
jgi:hypothetical protein